MLVFVLVFYMYAFLCEFSQIRVDFPTYANTSHSLDAFGLSFVRVLWACAGNGGSSWALGVLGSLGPWGSVGSLGWVLWPLAASGSFGASRASGKGGSGSLGGSLLVAGSGTFLVPGGGKVGHRPWPRALAPGLGPGPWPRSPVPRPGNIRQC